MNVVWFRSDLRVDDHSALNAAMQSGAPVAALYVITPQQWQSHDDAEVKVGFWIENVLSLREQLAALNVPLWILNYPDYSALEASLPNQLLEWGCTGLYFNREYPLNEYRRDIAVQKSLKAKGVASFTYHDGVLLKPGSVNTLAGQPYTKFTPFGRKARLLLDQSGVTSLPIPDPQPIAPKIEVDDPSSVLEGLRKPYRRLLELWPAGEREAQSRLQTFAEEAVGRYKDERDIPSVPGTSRLSPYLAAGVISVRRCWQMALGDGVGNETWLNELLWRDFYRHIMSLFPHVSRGEDFKRDWKAFPWRRDREQFQRWCDGETGVAIVDAAMRQLKEEGWMHNRLRMITAMFLTKNLLIDWRWGEQYFMEQLIDGDFAANNGGWQWSASTGTDAAPYFRIFNPESQAQRFDADQRFVKQYEGSGDQGFVLTAPASPIQPMVDLKASRQRAIDTFKNYNDSLKQDLH